MLNEQRFIEVWLAIRWLTWHIIAGRRDAFAQRERAPPLPLRFRRLCEISSEEASSSHKDEDSWTCILQRRYLIIFQRICALSLHLETDVWGHIEAASKRRQTHISSVENQIVLSPHIGWVAWLARENLHVGRHSTRKHSCRWQTRATRKHAKITPIRRAYNVVANNTGLSSFV